MAVGVARLRGAPVSCSRLRRTVAALAVVTRAAAAARASVVAALTIAAVELLAAGCATAPPVLPSPEEGWYGLLQPNAELYLSIAVKPERELVKRALVEAGLSQGAIEKMIDHTDRIYLSSGGIDHAGPNGVAPQGPVESGAVPGAAPAIPPRFEAVAVGSYPKGLVDMQIGASGQWERASIPDLDAGRRGPVTWWWQNRATRLQLALPSEKIALISNGGMGGMAERLAGAYSRPLPAEARERLDAADFAFYLPRPALLLASLTPLGENIPAETLLVTMSPLAGAAHKSDRRWAIEGLLTTRDERGARALGATLKLLIATEGIGEIGLSALPLPLAQARVAVRGRTVELFGMSLGSARLSELLAELLRQAGMAEVAK